MTNRQKVAAALRSGEFTQAEGTLQNGNSYCCLGVACVIAEREGVAANRVAANPGKGGELRGTLLAHSQPAVKAWLGFTDDEEGRAAAHNDGGKSFAQIAHWCFK